MANFGKKMVGLAAAAVGFAGMAFGQAPNTCSSAMTRANYIRVEGTTEQLGDLMVSCTGVTTAGNATVVVTLNPALPITNKVVNTSTGAIDATATIGATVVNATVTGSQATFNVALPAGDSTITIQNIRVNANTLVVPANGFAQVNATVATQGTVYPSVTNVGQPLSYAQSGLGASKVFTDTTLGTAGAKVFSICNAISAANPAYVLQVNEGFNSAFKLNEGPGADHATRLLVTFGNLPQNGLTVYIPTNVTTGTATVGLSKSLTGAFAAMAAGSNNPAGVPSGYAAIPVSGGSLQVMYEVQAESQTVADQINIPVYFAASANPANASGTSTVQVSFAPDSGKVPNFTASTTGAVNGSAFNLCTTSLLFPFVTNASGFDTGMAIANTSADPFGTTNGAAAQSGTCTLNFYGGSSNPTAVTTASVAAGTVYTNLVSSVAAGFQGYMIAQCNFQYAHGFAFITDGFGGGGRGLAQGYLALVIPDVTLTGGRRTNAAGESLNN